MAMGTDRGKKRKVKWVQGPQSGESICTVAVPSTRRQARRGRTPSKHRNKPRSR